MYAFDLATAAGVPASLGGAPSLSGIGRVEALEQLDAAILAGINLSDASRDAANGGLGDYGGTFLLIQGDILDHVDLFSLAASSAFTVDGPALVAGGHAFASYAVRAGEIRIEFYPGSVDGGVATKALVDEVVRSIRYRYDSDTPPAQTALTVAFGENEPDGPVALGSVPVFLTALNDDPVNSVPTAQAIVEGSSLVFSAANGNAVSIADPDATTLEFTVGVAHGTLTFATTHGLRFVTGDGTADSFMTVRGSAADINAALDGLVYEGAAGYRGRDGLYVRTSDLGGSGVGGTLTDKDTIGITVMPKGDLIGDSGDNDFGGGEDGDRFLFQQGGHDHGQGRGGDDLFLFGDQWDSGDRVEGGSGEDTLQLIGAYRLRFGEDQIDGVERLLLIGGPTGTNFDYWLQSSDGNVAAGARLRVDASDLVRSEHLTFDGSAESDGSFEIVGGFGDDVVTGGRQADLLIGGNGADILTGLRGNDRLVGGMGADRLIGGNGLNVYAYASAAESTSTQFDTITGFDFFFDRLDLPFEMRGWSGSVAAGALRAASFGADLGKAVNVALDAHAAVLFTPDGGDYAGRTFVVIDGNGDGTYQAVQDYVIEFAQPVYALDTTAAIFI
ncbi:calcium-binding protein [Sphingosinicella sp. BN140058]|uniref:calcium-binding protein n=1 Tax=Sphingosinicella sp. BN140058 TaxID=1892855 RepID=UPI001011CDA5|nr:hypothetical protein [Sphingosinicella sp. BN140058]QAY77979.1 hypothetical protein ETR14_16685 [Sphingosinicella sp. BN140058]